MGDNAAQQNKKRKSKWETSYSAMSIRDAEKRLGIRINKLKATPIDTMLAKPNSLGGADVNKETMDAIKVKVYERILQYLAIEGYPTEADPDFNEANVSDLVFSTIGPVLYFVQKMRCDIRLTREKEITSVNNETGGVEEFVVVDQIAVSEEKFVLVIEAKRTSIGQAIKQLLLSLKDLWDNNGGGVVYGFVTTGQHWQMFSCDGASFQMTREITLVFNGMDEDKETWMKEGSVLVDFMLVALSNGGIVKEDVVVVAV